LPDAAKKAPAWVGARDGSVTGNVTVTLPVTIFNPLIGVPTGWRG
jgi:hypothetical protein